MLGLDVVRFVGGFGYLVLGNGRWFWGFGDCLAADVSCGGWYNITSRLRFTVLGSALRGWVLVITGWRGVGGLGGLRLSGFWGAVILF